MITILKSIVKRAALALCAVFSGYAVFIGVSLLYVGGRLRGICGIGIIAAAVLLLISGADIYTAAAQLAELEASDDDMEKEE